ncbi:MAG: MBL fold metallo-hydrolase [Caldilineales bacterium]|nr:MBL fold metallo-hydrolase [Caldilineales bacterium]
MTELIFLGIGAIRPAVPGDHTALFIRRGQAGVLLDAGPGLMAQLQGAGVSPDEVSHIYFSHQHGDHTLGSLMLLFHHRPRLIAAAPKVLDAWRALLDIAYPGYAARLIEDLTFHPLPVMLPHLWPGLPDVTAQIALVHHSHLPAYALRLDFAPTDGAPAFSLCYSGDTAPTECVTQLAAGVDLLIHEATFLEADKAGGEGIHSSARAAGIIAQQAGAKSLALVHRLAGDREAWRAEAAAAFAGRILVPLAGERLTLPGDLQSG